MTPGPKRKQIKNVDPPRPSFPIEAACNNVPVVKPIRLAKSPPRRHYSGGSTRLPIARCVLAAESKGGSLSQIFPAPRASPKAGPRCTVGVKFVSELPTLNSRATPRDSRLRPTKFSRHSARREWSDKRIMNDDSPFRSAQHSKYSREISPRILVTRINRQQFSARFPAAGNRDPIASGKTNGTSLE